MQDIREVINLRVLDNREVAEFNLFRLWYAMRYFTEYFEPLEEWDEGICGSYMVFEKSLQVKAQEVIKGERDKNVMERLRGLISTYVNDLRERNDDKLDAYIGVLDQCFYLLDEDPYLSHAMIVDFWVQGTAIEKDIDNVYRTALISIIQRRGLNSKERGWDNRQSEVVLNLFKGAVCGG